MITETRKYVQGGVIAERTRVCDVCGTDIPTGSVGWAYVQETKTQTQKRLLEEQGGHDEFSDICLACWEKVKEEKLRPMRDGGKAETKDGQTGQEENSGGVQRAERPDIAQREHVRDKDRGKNRRR